MYQKPEFQIIEIAEEDEILTCLIDKGDVSIDDIPTFDWQDPENP